MGNHIKYAVFSNSQKKLGLHYHDAHQIIFVTGGRADIIIDSLKYPLQKGTVVFINRFETHYLSNVSKDYERYEIRISPDILNDNETDYRLYSVLLNRPEGFNRTLLTEKGQFEEIFRRIVSEYQSDGAYKQLMLSHLSDMLFVTLFRAFPAVFSVFENQDLELVEEIHRIFENEIAEKHSLDEISKRLHINKFYLSHIFKRATGYSVMNYLKNLRLAKAKNLLCKTDKPISEITGLCGFADDSNFSRYFKQSNQMSPQEFRKKYVVK